MSTNRQWYLLHLVSSLLFIGLWANTSLAISYTFTEIARAPFFPSPGSFHHFPSAPSINSKGVVAFHATSATDEGIYTSTGGAIKTIVSSATDGYLSIVSASAINAAGQVAFKALKPSGWGVFRSDGTTTTTIADASHGFSFLSSGYPSINRSGTVAFYGTDISDGLFVGSGGPVTAIYRTGHYGLSYGPNDPAISDSGELAFIMSAGSGSSGMARGSGGPPVIVGAGFSMLSHVSIAPSGGKVAFRATTFGSPPDAIWVGTGPASAVPFASTAGPFSSFSFEAALSSTTTVFLADLDTGGEGLFTGPDVLSNKVLKTGDMLFGESVLGFPDLNRFAVNAAGQIAFRVVLSSGDLVIVRANPSLSKTIFSTIAVPEPALTPAVVFLAAIWCGGLRFRRCWSGRSKWLCVR